MSKGKRKKKIFRNNNNSSINLALKIKLMLNSQ